MTAQDPLLSDDLVTLLRALPEKALRDVIGILAASTSLSPFSGRRAEEAHRAAPGDPLRPYAKEVVAEILWWGSHDILRQFGSTTEWPDIVRRVARATDVDEKDRRDELPCWQVEASVLRKVLVNWENLSLERREDLLREQQRDFDAARGAVGLVIGGAARLGGAELLAIMVGEGAVIGAGAAVLAPLAPILAALGAFWAVYDLAGPALRVLRPVVVTVAFHRQLLRDRRTAESFED